MAISVVPLHLIAALFFFFLLLLFLIFFGEDRETVSCEGGQT